MKPDDRYYDIRGDRFIVRYSQVKTLNLEYFAITRESGAAAQAPVTDPVTDGTPVA